jgi:hypothetical protein
MTGKGSATSTAWPALDWAGWRETALTLQLYTQIVGKIRLSLTPWLNHGWQVPLYVSARGLASSPIPFGADVLEIEFDFIAHRLLMRTSRGEERSLALGPVPVADFYRDVLSSLAGLGVDVRIVAMPNEFPEAIPFAEDRTHRHYDPDAAHRFWRALLSVDGVFKHFRSGFLGKASPVHFFWGSFDLAVTRFSGRRAPLHPGGVPGLPDPVTREAYSHEVSSAGFWPGSDAYPKAAFYSYAYPGPPGFAEAAVKPAAARFEATLGEFLLDYDDVRGSADPEGDLMAFLQSTYDAAADLGAWDRGNLECALGEPRRVRPV